MSIPAPPITDRWCPGWPSLNQWAWSFVPFGLGLVAALLAAEVPLMEVTPNLRLYRTIYSIWLALALLVPALALFPHRRRGPSWWNVWRLFWTFSFMAYAVHLGYAWFGLFGDQIPLATAHPELYHVPKDPTVLDLVLVHQGAFVAYSNLGASALWAFDVLLSWLVPGEREGPFGWILTGERWLTWAWVIASAVVGSVYFPKHLVSIALGWIIILAVALSLLVRLLGWLLSRSSRAARGPRLPDRVQPVHLLP
jgi:hypothetical protein